MVSGWRTAARGSFWSDRLHSWKKKKKEKEASHGWRLASNSGFKSIKNSKGRKSLHQHRVSVNYSTRAHLSCLISWHLFTFTVDVCCHNFPYLKRNEGIPPMHWYCFFSLSLSLSPLTLCVPMRAISFHTRLGPSALSTKQCGRFLRAGCGRKSCCVPENRQPLKMRLYSSCRRPPA